MKRPGAHRPDVSEEGMSVGPGGPVFALLAGLLLTGASGLSAADPQAEARAAFAAGWVGEYYGAACFSADPGHQPSAGPGAVGADWFNWALDAQGAEPGAPVPAAFFANPECEDAERSRRQVEGERVASWIMLSGYAHISITYRDDQLYIAPSFLDAHNQVRRPLGSPLAVPITPELVASPQSLWSRVQSEHITTHFALHRDGAAIEGRLHLGEAIRGQNLSEYRTRHLLERGYRPRSCSFSFLHLERRDAPEGQSRQSAR